VAGLGKASDLMHGLRNQPHQVRSFTLFNGPLQSGRHTEGNLRLPTGKFAQIWIFARKMLKTDHVMITARGAVPDDRLTEQADGLEPKRIKAALDIGPDDQAVPGKARLVNPGHFPSEAILLNPRHFDAEGQRPVIRTVQTGLKRQIGAVEIVTIDGQGRDQTVRFPEIPAALPIQFRVTVQRVKHLQKLL